MTHLRLSIPRLGRLLPLGVFALSSAIFTPACGFDVDGSPSGGSEDSGSAADPDPNTDPDPSTDPNPDPNTDPNPSTDPDPDPNTDPDPSTDPNPDPNTDPEPDPEPEPEPDPEPEPEPEPQPESLCFDAEGAPIPYDYTNGLMSEYTFELVFSCDVGGYMEPLIAVDPEGLTALEPFVTDLTAWYRADILGCAGSDAQVPADAYPLVPIAESEEMSGADFDTTIALFMMVLDRHDGLPDGLDSEKKSKVEQRLKLRKNEAVKSNRQELTRRSSAPECAEPPPDSGGEGGAPG